MAPIIQSTLTAVNTNSALSGFREITLDVVSHASKIYNILYHHLWYTLLNKQTNTKLFTHKEIAEFAGCTERTVYSFIKHCEERGELTSENKGRNGILITMLKKGWELTKSLKTAFLAYFRDKGLIPYIYTTNTSPSGGKSNQPRDRIEKMCAKAGLTESQTRDVKEKVSTMSKIRNFGAVVSYFIQMVKGGIMKALLTSKDIEARDTMKERLKNQAQVEAKAILESKGIIEKIPSVNPTMEELDAFNAYHAMLSTYATNRLNELHKIYGN